MGMFDTVRARCPECGGEIEEQSKAGPCQLKDYNLYNAPAAVLVDLSEQELWCVHCDSRLKLRVHISTALEPADD